MLTQKLLTTLVAMVVVLQSTCVPPSRMPPTITATSPESVRTRLSFRTLFAGDRIPLNPEGPATYVLITFPSDWPAIWKAMIPTPPPTINFATEAILIVATSNKPLAEFYIQVDSLRVNAEADLFVFATESGPGKYCLGSNSGGRGLAAYAIPARRYRTLSVSTSFVAGETCR